jgi:murein DD-endopeptidase MepM/ murein hydrolase activator NlpD
MAHVRTPDFSRLDRNLDGVLPERDSRSRFDYRGEPKDVPAVSGQVCGFSRGNDQPSTEAILAAGMFGAPPISEVALQNVRAGGPATQEILSLLETFATASDAVRVAQGATPDGAPCPLYVSIDAEGVAKQTFWRFAPNDEPEGWFDEDGRRLGAALAPPRPGSRMSSPFGPRRYYGRPSGGGFHDGIDYEAHVGQPILAAADGVVEHRGNYFEYGLTVKIRHAAQFTTLYAHMSRFAGDIAVGRRVHKGEVIGYVGMTGRSTGAHLHFSTIINGKFSNPAPYLSSDGDGLKAHTLVGFRKWQDDVRAAVQQMRDRQRRNPVQDDDWTSRM